MNKRILLGVTSGIAAYKTLDLITQLRSEAIDVFVIMTKHAAQMVSAAEFEKASGHPVSLELFGQDFDYKKVLKKRSVDHIDLADASEMMIVAPATANTIAKLAHGLADDYLTTTALAMKTPLIVCPSMNVNMWNNPAVQDNIKTLRSRGMHIIEPETGMLACGYIGAGRLASIESIKQYILEQLAYSNSLAGKKIIVTAGGTMEKIDAVRVITNRSSGKMGIAIAEACYARGADVLLLRAKTAVQPRFPIKEAVFTSTEDLWSLLKPVLNEYDYLFHTAAVSDFTVANKMSGKISSKQEHQLTLQPQIKILDQIKKTNKKMYLIAFKAEAISDQKKLLDIAKKRMDESGADAIVTNDISKHDRGFEVDTNEVSVLFADGRLIHLPLDTKRNIAAKVASSVFE